MSFSYKSNPLSKFILEVLNDSFIHFDEVGNLDFHENYSLQGEYTEICCKMGKLQYDQKKIICAFKCEKIAM